MCSAYHPKNKGGLERLHQTLKIIDSHIALTHKMIGMTVYISYSLQ